jgi:hypothetical protein
MSSHAPQLSADGTDRAQRLAPIGVNSKQYIEHLVRVLA